MMERLAGKDIGGKCTMKNYDTFFNNELQASIGILSVLKATKELPISKVLLIQSLLSYKKILSLLISKKYIIRSIEELIIKSDFTLSNFNKRYEENFILSINSLMLLKELKLILIEGYTVRFNGQDFNFQDKSLGKKAKYIIKASDKLSQILLGKESSSLYLSLRVEL